ncbi:peptidylprolyl isomerase [Tamlana haliotis]|uniref:Periplasmic chaperone PpiD n=1 Tax=Pseudotamlana haliotis TaxID=2614804 RepID=A0A6N6MF31_9FLAO|nr:SurA N-terminal domain-containing protein [Tamlana haliotis]KAB1067397.1 peptidylprolyl isomerase [Tamlana haliotis]
MAVLNKIRQRSLFLILIIALALFAFVLADLFKNSDALTAKSQNVIATVNGKEITREDFLQKVEIAQRQAGPSTTSTQIMNRVWDQEVRQAIMETQFEELGITVEKDQMRDLLRTSLASSPEFLNEAGLFDENKMNEYIANLKETNPAGFSSWVNYEKQIAANALNQNYYNMVKAGLTGTLAEGELEHKLEGNKVDLKYVQIAYSTISDSLVKVSKSDISDYINEHKTQFEVEASRDIRFVEFKEEASVEDENGIKAELNRYKNGQLVDENGRKNEIPAFAQATDNEDYINSVAASDLKFDDSFVFRGSLPSDYADDIFNLNEGEVFGPYKDNGFFKISKVIAVKQIPDSAKVRHILIPHLGAQSAGPEVTKTEDQAKVLADSLLNVLESDSSKFPEYVTEYSSDQGSVNNGGRYDWHAYGSMVPEFNDFEFNGQVGDLGVVKTVFGFHIIEIEGLKDSKRAVQVGTIARRIEPSEATTDKIFRDASNFEINAGEGDFEAVAKENKLTVRPVNGIKALDESIPGVGNQRPIVRWAFEEQVDAGDIKRFNIPGGYVIAQVVAKNEAGLMSVDNATARVLPILRKEKKAEMIKDRVSATTLEDIAAAENTTVKSATGVNMKNPTISGAGREPYVVGAAFGLNEGETSGLLEGEKGVYAVLVTKATPAVELENYQAAANRVEQQKTAVVNSRLYSALKEAAEIEDNRAQAQIQ